MTYPFIVINILKSGNYLYLSIPDNHKNSKDVMNYLTSIGIKNIGIDASNTHVRINLSSTTEDNKVIFRKLWKQVGIVTNIDDTNDTDKWDWSYGFLSQEQEQTSVQQVQEPLTSIDQEVMTYLNNYDDTFSYEGHQDYQEVYIPTTEDSPTPQQPVVTTPPKQYDLSKEYMDKFNISGLNLFTNATVHNWQ